MKHESKLKHLELIQGVVTRMGGNLFFLRGWSITLIAGVLAILSQKDNVDSFPGIVLLVVVVMFWVYDGYFLALERKYRDLYNKVRKLPEAKIDFSMDIREFNSNKKNTVIWCMCSKTIAPFYLMSLAGAIYLLVRGIV
jgi:hypothetical protein